MRGILGYVGAAGIAALVATVWVVLRPGDESLVTAFRLPDVVAYAMPDLAIGLRRLLGFYHQASPPMAMLIDFPAGLLIFLVINLPGALLLTAAEATWGTVASWRTLKPLWGALAFAVMAATLILTSIDNGLPVLGDLQVSPIGTTLAALFAGAILGLASPQAKEHGEAPW
jgi:hypothetical protein